jgi:ComF family protein
MRKAWLDPRQWPLPGGCWICRGWGRERLCRPCVERFVATGPRCPRCALPLEAPLCGHCLRDPLPLQAVSAALGYQPPWDELLHALKYGQALGLLPALTELLLKRLEHDDAARTSVTLLPVPLHPRRLGERGYNQAALLAQSLGKRLALPVQLDTLHRVVDTPTQTRLGRRERLANLRQAFALGAQVAGLHLVLVDDVMTTGATLATLATLLQREGAARVDAWVLARTPDPHHD